MYSEPVKMAAVVKQFIKKQADDYRRTRELPGSAGFIVSSFLTSGFDVETGEVFRDAWDADFEVDRIKRCLDYRDCFISRMPEESHGAFWKQTIYSPRAGKSLNLPLKKGLDPQKYGGYSSEQFAYFMLYEGKNPKGKNQAKLAGVPIPIAQKISKGELSITEYAQEIAREEGLVFSRVLRGRILKYSKIRYGQDEYFIPALDVVYSARQLALTGDLLKTAQDVGDNKVSSFCLDDGALMRLYDELRDKALFLCSGFKTFIKLWSRVEKRFLSYLVIKNVRFCSLFLDFTKEIPLVWIFLL